MSNITFIGKSMSMRSILLFIAFLICINTGCTRIVYISEKVKPEIQLQDEHKNICFVNLFDYATGSVVSRRDARPYYYGLKGLISGLHSFDTDSSFTFSVADTLYRGIDKSELTALLSPEMISSFCKKAAAGYVIVLDSMSIHFEKETVVTEDYGLERRSRYYYLNADFFLTLYNSDGKYINRSKVDESELYGITAARDNMRETDPPLSGTEQDILSLSYQAGNDYFLKFRPGINTLKEELYRGQAFSESNSLIFSKKWGQAIEILEQLARSKDEDIAVKARHNLNIARKAAAASRK